ncbi:MAG TPA: hypothetical protein VMW58_05780 [Anaerolineae bacterium]|nr:hypothetical protein [Anaerolineae bacterium]
MGIDAPYIQIQCRGIATRYPFVYAPGDVAAIPRHEGSISSDTAVLRGCSLLALAKLEHRCPDVRTSCATAFAEGYARNHGAIALARFKQRQITAGLSHATQALRHSLRTPGWGTLALFQWVRRRQVRGTGAWP